MANFYNPQACLDSSMCFGKTEWPELVGMNPEAAVIISKENSSVYLLEFKTVGDAAPGGHCCNRVVVWIDPKQDYIIVQVPTVG